MAQDSLDTRDSSWTSSLFSSRLAIVRPILRLPRRRRS